MQVKSALRSVSRQPWGIGLLWFRLFGGTLFSAFVRGKRTKQTEPRVRPGLMHRSVTCRAWSDGADAARE